MDQNDPFAPYRAPRPPPKPLSPEAQRAIGNVLAVAVTAVVFVGGFQVLRALVRR